MVELPAENGWHFTNHPGYQTEHPAHPHGTTGIVPGMVEAPRSTKSGGGVSSSRDNNTKKQSSSSSSGSGGSGANGGEGAATGSGNGNGGDGNDNHPYQKKPKTEHLDTENNDFFYTEIKVDGQTYTITTPKTDDVRDLECAICLGLVRDIALQCLKCGNNICSDHRQELEENGQLLCPTCRAENNFQTSNVRLRINRLLWNCPKGCGSTHSLSDMASHIRSCDYEDTYFCDFERCSYTGSYQGTVNHEAVCLWRPVNLGAARFFAWQTELINQHQADVQGDEVPDSIENEAGYIITILKQA